MAREPVQPEHLEEAAAFVTDVCRERADADWDLRAGPLEWSIRETVVHMTSTCTFYALHLAGRTRAELPVTLASVGAPSNHDLIAPIAASAQILADLARAAPPEQRGFHQAGLADVEGSLAMGCSELLVHVTDVTAGFGARLPEDVCGRVVSRLDPWTSHELLPSVALLWANGRVDIGGAPPDPAPCPWHCAPLDEPDTPGALS